MKLSRSKMSPKLRIILERIEAFNRAELSQAWERLNGTPPPKSSSRKFLMRALCYEHQLKASAGLSKADQKTLNTSHSIGPASILLPEARVLKNNPSQMLKLVPGSRLVREWNGRTYTVSVIEEGFVYQDKVWKFLSAIAKDITSAHWSGPRFFGVKGAW